MKYILRVITKEFLQPIDDVRDFIRRIVEDDKTSAVEFDDYIRYWKTENQGVILAKVSTLIPFNIIRNRIGAEWCAADKIGNSFVVDSRTSQINCEAIYWMGIDLEEE
jgi:hypothetical protein